MSGWNWFINKRATVGFLSGLAMVICLSVFSYWFVEILIQTTSWVVHAREAVKEVRDLSLLVEAADSDELRFLITGDPQFKTAVEKSYASIPSEFNDIIRVTRQEPAQQKRIARLRELIERKHEFTTVRMLNRKEGEVDNDEKTGDARQSNDLIFQIRNLIKEIEDEESQLLETRTQSASEMAQRAYWVMPLGGLAGIGVLLVAIWSFNRQAARLLRAEEEIRRWSNQLDDRVKERTQELQSALNELESFSYSVAHDLRAPVRAIGGYSQIIAEEFSEDMADEGKKILRVVRKEAERMGRLIDDLLAFSRVGRQRMEWAPVDMTALAQTVFDELAARFPKRKFDFQLLPLPPISGDASLLRQVWVNLISNAIKFTGRRELARIEIGSRPGDAGEIYFVKDNGDGFDMRYVDKLFNVFHRLHHEEEFTGTGVGLALAQRIIHRHGGTIWAEGKPGVGAQFYFSLPSKK